MSPRAGTTDTSLLLAPGCNLACPVCDCRAEAADAATRQRELRRGGGVLELRGEAAIQRDLPRIVREAKEAGWSAVYARTNGVAYAAEGRAEELVAAGLSGIVFFLASDRAAVHDAIARARGAFAAGLRGLSAIARSGLDVAFELPVLDPSIQDLRAAIARLVAIAPGAHRVRLYSPPALRAVDGRSPRELAPPRWDRVKDALLRAMEFARERGLEISLTERDGIPLCAIASVTAEGTVEIPERVLADRGGRPMPRRPTSSLAPICETCAAARVCPGTTSLYLFTHGSGGLSPLKRAPRDRSQDAWDETRKQAAQKAFFTVLRPTVHCNQDCFFCSANETSRNVEDDPARMMRRIARLARTGVEQISFSGGEPTLSRSLVDYVTVAKRVGVRSVELVTNAVLLDKREKVDALVEAGVTNVFVSLHAHDEALSRQITRKIGDHARTVQALHHLARHPHIRLDVNHVVSTQNFRHLVRFVEWMHAEFRDRIGISFAYVTPQYKALERLADHLPRYRDAMPYLKRAIARASELGIEVIVGSRQGVPPCQLDEFMPHSDLLAALSGALTEDQPQKQKGPACEACRFDLVCTGVWKPYAALFGTDELRPVPGDKLTPEQCLSELRIPKVDQARALRFGDGRVPRSDEIPLPEEPRERVHLPIVESSPEEAKRIAILGSGRRALAFAAALSRANGLSLAGIASPHAPDKDLPEIPASVLRARTLDELSGATRIDAVIVATNTREHASIARAALERGLPCLVEKPLGATIAEADALASEGGARILVAQQLRASGGLAEILGELGDRTGDARPVEIEVVHRATPSSPASLHAWSRTALYELLIHLGDVARAVAGEDLRVRKAMAKGGGRPERVTIRARGAGPSRPDVTIDLALAEAEDALIVRVHLASGRRLSWVRSEGRDAVEIVDDGGKRTRTPARGGDLERLLAAFLATLEGARPPLVTAEDGVRAMQFSAEAIGALEAAGAPFDRAAEPKRVASVPLRERLG